MNALRHSPRDGRTGAAITETALLCFFLYVPILLMVVVWGDLTLDKERAQSAGAYMAFESDTVETGELRDRFFPGATGNPDPTLSSRAVGVNLDRAVEPEPYTTEGPDARNRDRDVQQMLFAMAIGEIHSSLEWVESPSGGMELRPVVHTSRDEVARYLVNNEIVEDFSIPSEIHADPGESLEISTGTSAARSPTEYGYAATRVLNGQWGGVLAGREPPLWLSDVRFWTAYRSPYLNELTGYSYGGTDYDFGGPARRGGPGIRMTYGTYDRGEQSDGSFTTGYTYLFNTGGVASAAHARSELWGLSPELFGQSDSDARMSEMVLPVGTLGDMPEQQLPTPFLQPGDGRQNE